MRDFLGQRTFCAYGAGQALATIRRRPIPLKEKILKEQQMLLNFYQPIFDTDIVEFIGQQATKDPQYAQRGGERLQTDSPYGREPESARRDAEAREAAAAVAALPEHFSERFSIEKTPVAAAGRIHRRSRGRHPRGRRVWAQRSQGCP